jgi:hypothetical protein
MRRVEMKAIVLPRDTDEEILAKIQRAIHPPAEKPIPTLDLDSAKVTEFLYAAVQVLAGDLIHDGTTSHKLITTIEIVFTLKEMGWNELDAKKAVDILWQQAERGEWNL